MTSFRAEKHVLAILRRTPPLRRRVLVAARNAALANGVAVSRAADPAAVDRTLRKLTPERIQQPLIRLGSDSDGGYLIPDDLDGITSAISPGVADEISFDLALADAGIHVSLLDGSVDGPPIDRPELTFRKVFLDTYESPSTTTLTRLLEEHPDDEDLLLEIDVEGAEYRVLHSATSEELKRFRIIVIEFHHLADMASASRLPDLDAALTKLSLTHRPVHVHMNNFQPPVRLGGHRIGNAIEATYHRRDRSQRLDGPVHLPHPLDRDCSTTAATLPPPALWR